MPKPNPIVVLLCIFLICTCKDKRTDSSISLDERQIKECFCGWQRLLSSSLLVSVLGDVTSAYIKLLFVGMTSILHKIKSIVCRFDVIETEQARISCVLIANQNIAGDTNV